MELHMLADWLDGIFSPFVMVDGLLFFSRSSMSHDELVQKVRSHESAEHAQYWMNIVLLDGLISAACGDEWESSDPSAQSILATVSAAWDAQVRADFPGVVFSIHPAIDDEYGDFGLRLSSEKAAS